MLWLSYADDATRTQRVAVDADELASILGATHVISLVIDSTGGPSHVTLRARRKDIGSLPFPTDADSSAVKDVVTRLLGLIASPETNVNESSATRAPRDHVDNTRTPVIDVSPNATVAAPVSHVPQESNSALVPIAGVVASAVGIAGFTVSWSNYAERYSLRSRQYDGAVSYATRDKFNTAGKWLMAGGALGAGTLVAAEAALLPKADGVPAAAWLIGGLGAAVGGVGLGFTVSKRGADCIPGTLKPCAALTSDSLLGPLLMLQAVPLLAVPAVYTVRSWLRPRRVELSVDSSMLVLRGTF